MRFIEVRRERERWLSARKRWRHPCEKGSESARLFKEAVQRMLDHRFWAKHPEPFNKRLAGKRRRSERRWKEQQRAETYS